MKDTRKDAVDELSSFLRGEIAAVESYRLALEKVEALFRVAREKKFDVLSRVTVADVVSEVGEIRQVSAKTT